ncbi:uncharacterized protein LOC126376874 [Pectinophora gossypiella]|uniref:uncharacterized protein LOC126376874 n=1 Tax=Pectinophora gossypiella TaxID=13191 RepID=UPI00214EC64B|nr:uncharacterized protein LOC126376874 [Pectinophora gossypiella]XP_049880388.1 uncharacterized protein LOC126376874 [Pectinophora gossypiella]
MDRTRRVLLLLYLRRWIKKRQKLRRYWIHPFLLIMNNGSHFIQKYNALKIDHIKFFDFFRMSISSFEELLDRITPHIAGKYGRGRPPLEPLEMLGLTVRFLASGNTFKDMHLNNYRGKSTIAKTVKIVCGAIWKHLLIENIPKITTERLTEIAENFDNSANFPNCIGALDGKYIRIWSPKHGGSLFYNYKNYHSVLLLALVDAKYRFIYVDIGAYGKECDSTVYNNSKLNELLLKGQLPLPTPKPLPGSQTPCPVADEGLPLTNNIMRPYPGKHLTIQQRVFNYRLSRARRYVECAFGILANKWRVFHRPLNVSLNFCTNIIKASCVLHNFILNREGAQTFEDMIIDDSFIELQQSTQEGRTRATDIF